MIFRYEAILILFTLINISCICDHEETSVIPPAQANIIRLILRENGYSINDNQIVDGFLEFASLSQHDNQKDYYWLILPEKNSNILTISKKISDLDNMFHGVKAPPRFWDTIKIGDLSIIENYGKVDSLIIITDSTIIDVKILSISDNKLQKLPVEIRFLRGTRFNFSYNKLITLPNELMQITNSPLLYNDLVLSLNDNIIDTKTISDTLDEWLMKYAGANWKSTQKLK